MCMRLHTTMRSSHQSAMNKPWTFTVEKFVCHLSHSLNGELIFALAIREVAFAV